MQHFLSASNGRKLWALVHVLAFCVSCPYAFAQTVPHYTDSVWLPHEWSVSSDSIDKSSSDLELLAVDDTEFYVYFHGAKNSRESDSLLMVYLNNNITIPQGMNNCSITKVSVFFKITVSGKSKICTISLCDDKLRRELIRVVSEMPDWIWDGSVPLSHRKEINRMFHVNL